FQAESRIRPFPVTWIPAGCLPDPPPRGGLLFLLLPPPPKAEKLGLLVFPPPASLLTPVAPLRSVRRLRVASTPRRRAPVLLLLVPRRRSTPRLLKCALLSPSASRG